MTEDQNVLSADSRGRVRVPVDRREALLDEFERSGLSGTKFAQLAGIKYQTFAVWARKRRMARGTDVCAQVAARTVSFVEAVVDRGLERRSKGHGLVVELPGGARALTQSPSQLQMVAELLRMLAPTGVR